MQKKSQDSSLNSINMPNRKESTSLRIPRARLERGRSLGGRSMAEEDENISIINKIHHSVSSPDLPQAKPKPKLSHSHKLIRTHSQQLIQSIRHKVSVLVITYNLYSS